MSRTDPLALTDATRFKSSTLRTRSHSPSRSPARKSQFITRELDPLLSNLSPDSTLRALQATATITNEDSKQDALTRSIAEASPAERETGIRAAVAAQKLKEWYQEVSRWSWPARRDRGWGAGFLPRQQDPAHTNTVEEVSYLGTLPALRVAEYQDRIEDIRDGIEALELDDVKDHVFSTHVPQSSDSAPLSSGQRAETKSTGYGRMRDFTALITATVIQALPQLASLTALLDTWDIRLLVLRQIPDVTHAFRTTRAGVNTAYSIVRSTDAGPLVTMQEYEATKGILGAKVASLGAKLDKLLDMLEGQEDSLPKSWIDSLENIETEYAAWVVEAEHVAIRNDLLSKALAEQKRSGTDQRSRNSSVPLDRAHVYELNAGPATPAIEKGPLGQPRVSDTEPAELPNSELSSGTSVDRLSPLKGDSSKTSPLMITTPASGHNRGKSEVSIADSTFSVMSGISNAEIVDATSTQVLSSPKISVVDNPFPAGREDSARLMPLDHDDKVGSRPPMIQRASTAAIEVIPKESVKQVTLTRSRSHDLLSQTSSPFDRPSTSSHVLAPSGDTGSNHTLRGKQPEFGNRPASLVDSFLEPGIPSMTVSPSPSLRVEPLLIRNKNDEIRGSQTPDLPRRSSKRLSQASPVERDLNVPTTIASTSVQTPTASRNIDAPLRQSAVRHNGTLEDRIKDILSTMPSDIRLAEDSEGDETLQNEPSSIPRSSVLAAAPLTLSPAKNDRANRHASPGDVRLFHLTKFGQPRDAPPIKLFVRAVGEHGERVMVRVGGGWADLAEYLREYSLHHGHRGLNNGSLEVASFPTPLGLQRDSPNSSQQGIPTSQSKLVSAAAHSPSSGGTPTSTSELGDTAPLVVGKSRHSNRGMLSHASSNRLSNNGITPSLPSMGTTYTMQMPTTVTTIIDGVTSTHTIEPMGSHSAGSRPLSVSSSVNGRPLSTTAITPSPPSGHTTYTPLGAAGPMSSSRRVASQTPHSRESWVEGMVDKARAVSGGTTFVQGPTITTSTTMVSRATPKSRRVSAMPALSPASSSGTISPPTPTSQDNQTPDRSKPRGSLGDMSGIRRVFLRRKSDK